METNNGLFGGLFLGFAIIILIPLILFSTSITKTKVPSFHPDNYRIMVKYGRQIPAFSAPWHIQSTIIWHIRNGN